MIKNYFRIAWRGLKRNKVFSMINILGLATGLAACLLIMLYILDESAYDKHHEHGGRVFRIASRNEKGETWAAAPAPLSYGMIREIPEVLTATRLMTFPDIETMLLTYDKGQSRKQFFENRGYYVDSTFFNVLTYDFIYGDQASAMDQPNSIVLSKPLSAKFFGPADPVGESIRVNTPFGEFDYTVRGVFADDQKSHIPANYFLSMRNNDMWNWVKNQTSWTSNNVFFTYVRLKEEATLEGFSNKLKPFFDRHAAEDFKAAGLSKELVIQPLPDIYLHSSMGNEIAPGGNITYLYILGSIAGFILLIACINFMNLSTARSQRRAREVGVRKVIGAGRRGLVLQFMGESFLMCGLSLIFGLFIAWTVLPIFNSITGKDIHAFDKPELMVWIAVLTLLTGFLSGLYPSFYLSSFKPLAVLKGKMLNNFSAAAIRKGLVVFQFTVSVCLVLGAIIIWKQLDFLKQQQLGFSKEQKLILPLQQGFNNNEQTFLALKNELKQIPGITSVTSGSSYPGIQNLSDMLFFPSHKTKADVVDIHLSAIGSDYLETLGMQLLSGRTFSDDFRSDSAGIILNETAARELGYTPSTAIGKTIRYEFSHFQGAMSVIGVVKDFNFESLHTAIKPHGFTSGMFGSKFGYLIASITTRDFGNILQRAGDAWSTVLSSTPFVYRFLDQDFQRNYEKEKRTSQIVISFTIIAIVIACLGLFGLSAFSAEQRTKEIGIRKVLGASVSNVTGMLSKDFIRLVSISILIASPLAWLAMNRWLQEFAYRIQISWWMFVVAGVIALFVAVITVCVQAMKAGLANPVKSLRNE